MKNQYNSCIYFCFESNLHFSDFKVQSSPILFKTQLELNKDLVQTICKMVGIYDNKPFDKSAYFRILDQNAN